MKMTLREALKIQAEHILWYGGKRANLAQVVADLTHIEGFDLDAPMDMTEVNRMVPRGAQIEWLCGIDNSKLD